MVQVPFINKRNMEEMMALVGTVPALISAQPAYAAIANLRDKNFHCIFDALNYLPPPEYGAVPQELSARSVNVNDVILGRVPASSSSSNCISRSRPSSTICVGPGSSPTTRLIKRAPSCFERSANKDRFSAWTGLSDRSGFGLSHQRHKNFVQAEGLGPDPTNLHNEPVNLTWLLF